jgi:hypothetical protein
MSFESGNYNATTEKEVHYWPEPDKDGPGEEVWEDRFDNTGRSLGRALAKDNAGNVLKEYPAPEGFIRRRSYDGTEYHVKADASGRDEYRNRNGEAIGIKPGEAVVIHPNGDFETLTDEYARYIFSQTHSRTGEAEEVATEEVPE